MRHLGDLVPGKPDRIFDRILESWLSFATGNNIKPIAIAPVFGDAPFIRRKEDHIGISCLRGQDFNLGIL